MSRTQIDAMPTMDNSETLAVFTESLFSGGRQQLLHADHNFRRRHFQNICQLHNCAYGGAVDATLDQADIRSVETRFKTKLLL